VHVIRLLVVSLRTVASAGNGGGGQLRSATLAGCLRGRARDASGVNGCREVARSSWMFVRFEPRSRGGLRVTARTRARAARALRNGPGRAGRSPVATSVSSSVFGSCARARRDREGVADDGEPRPVGISFWMCLSGAAHASCTEVHCRRCVVEGSSLGHYVERFFETASIHATEGRRWCLHQRHPSPLWAYIRRESRLQAIGLRWDGLLRRLGPGRSASSTGTSVLVGWHRASGAMSGDQLRIVRRSPHRGGSFGARTRLLAKP
jgi:hypothetical protein